MQFRTFLEQHFLNGLQLKIEWCFKRRELERESDEQETMKQCTHLSPPFLYYIILVTFSVSCCHLAQNFHQGIELKRNEIAKQTSSSSSSSSSSQLLPQNSVS